MKIKWSLDINTGAVERSEAARALRLAGATVVGPVTARADQLWHVCGTNFSGGALFLPLNKFRSELILGGSKFNVTGLYTRLYVNYTAIATARVTQHVHSTFTSYVLYAYLYCAYALCSRRGN